MEKLSLYKQEIAIATIVVHKLLFGCFRLPEFKKRRDLEDYINSVVVAQLPLFDYDLKSAQYHALERSRLSKIGKIPDAADSQIASIAVCSDLILVTNNISDFEDFYRLRIEN